MTNTANSIHAHVKPTVYFLNDPNALLEDSHVLSPVQGFDENESCHLSNQTVQRACPQNAYL